MYRTKDAKRFMLLCYHVSAIDTNFDPPELQLDYLSDYRYRTDYRTLDRVASDNIWEAI